MDKSLCLQTEPLCGHDNLCLLRRYMQHMCQCINRLRVQTKLWLINHDNVGHELCRAQQ